MTTDSRPLPRIGERVEGYVARAGQLREFKTANSAFFLFKAITASGSVGCVVWHGQVSFKAGDYLKLWGEMKLHKDAPQLAVHRYEVLDREDFAPDDFAAASRRPLAEMRTELAALVAQLATPELQALVRHLLLEDPATAPAFARAPAAKTHHHSTVGGLLEHSLAVTHRALGMIRPGDGVDRELVIAGGLLHDLGKIEEYDLTGPEVGYSEAGNLVGHVVLGHALVLRAMAQLPPLPPGRATHLAHILLSHQGRLEYGSPVEPRSAEAFLVHHADAVDAHLFQVQRAGEEFPEARMAFSRSLNRMVLANPQLD